MYRNTPWLHMVLLLGISVTEETPSRMQTCI